MTEKKLSVDYEKFLEIIISELKIDLSERFKKKVANFCTKSIETISLESSKLCEEQLKNILSEKNLFFVFYELNWDHYILEMKEEKNRIFDEELKLRNIYNH